MKPRDAVRASNGCLFNKVLVKYFGKMILKKKKNEINQMKWMLRSVGVNGPAEAEMIQRDASRRLSPAPRQSSFNRTSRMFEAGKGRKRKKKKEKTGANEAWSV